MFQKFFLLLLPFCFFSNTLKSQTSAYNNILNLYDSNLKNQKVLYNGYTYNRITGLMKGDPFFSNSYISGFVNYDSEEFNDIPLLYDLVNDNIIIEHNDTRGLKIELVLIKEKVKRFSIDGHHFVNLSPGTFKGDDFIPGFYEVLYDGNLKVFIKHFKVHAQEVNENERRIYNVFRLKTKYLLFNNDAYYFVNSKKSLLKVLKDHKKELNKYYNNSHLEFYKDTEMVLKNLVQYYDTIVNENE